MLADVTKERKKKERVLRSKRALEYRRISVDFVGWLAQGQTPQEIGITMCEGCRRSCMVYIYIYIDNHA